MNISLNKLIEYLEQRLAAARDSDKYDDAYSKLLGEFLGTEFEWRISRVKRGESKHKHIVQFLQTVQAVWRSID